MGDEIVQLPVKRRQKSNELMLVQPHSGTCNHFPAAFVVDVKAGKCTCRRCGGEVSPIFVLEQLMHKESQWMATRNDYQDRMARLSERSKTKCQHCQKMTRISR